MAERLCKTRTRALYRGSSTRSHSVSACPSRPSAQSAAASAARTAATGSTRLRGRRGWRHRADREVRKEGREGSAAQAIHSAAHAIDRGSGSRRGAGMRKAGDDHKGRQIGEGDKSAWRAIHKVRVAPQKAAPSALRLGPAAVREERDAAVRRSCAAAQQGQRQRPAQHPARRAAACRMMQEVRGAGGGAGGMRERLGGMREGLYQRRTRETRRRPCRRTGRPRHTNPAPS